MATKQEAVESRNERDGRIRAAMLAGKNRDEIAADEGVSRATVDRVLRATTDAEVSTSTKAGDKKRATAAAERKAERAAAKKRERETAKEQPNRDAAPEQADPSVAEGAPTRAPSQRIAMTRKQVLGFNEKWDADDVKKIERELDRLDAKSFATTSSGSYVRVEARDGSIVAAIEKGRIRFPKGSAPKGAEKLDEKWSAISFSTKRTSA